ncbi:hypothetical protein NP493_732g02055 [Ridgeia piscesae]|uniref:WD repeat-containing protein on Y chromosome n=1 Tax=Ridgeia piscesae TaxID=27915 RepID=A0AAD9KR95_RIDPI|nr:hypothetical protein NP493_732g02055 [Ridgeia piscesae]
MNTCPDNTLLFTGDSSGYIRVWDISHYLVRGRGCSDEEHAERQDVWDSFPMIKWLQRLEEVNMLHLDFHCMKKAHEWNTPHLLTSFRGHSTVINSIDHFENNFGSVDCSVRLWTLNGRFMGIFGQSRLWELSHGNQYPPRRHRSDRYHRPRGFLLPPDIRKSGSCTTLHVMNGFTPNRWIRYVNLVRSVNLLVSFLHRSSSERLFREKQARCPAYHAFSLLEINDIDFPQIGEMLNDVSARYSLHRCDQVLIGCSQTLPCLLLPPLYLLFLFFLSSSFRCSSSFTSFVSCSSSTIFLRQW